ncbi:tetratricopeptide repeat protein [Candidatus Poribacteria bacterium]|nr:tetratricopeptide repeat protein [Candidatus Poribacteria bacterium]
MSNGRRAAFAVEAGLLALLIGSLSGRIAFDRGAWLWQPAELSADIAVADAAFDAKDLAKASVLYAESIARNPEDSRSQVRLAFTLHRNSWNESALHLLNQALGRDPAMIDALLLRARVLRDDGESDAAVADYQRALSMQPDNAEALYYLGTTYQASREMTLAAESYLAAIAADPELTRPPFEDLPFGIQARVQLGRAYRQLATAQLAAGNREDGAELVELAIEELREAVREIRRAELAASAETEAELVSALRQQIGLLRRTGDPNSGAVLAALEEIVKVDPTDTGAWVDAGMVRYRNARTRAELELAVRAFQRAVETDPLDLDAQTALKEARDTLALPEEQLIEALR